MKDYKKYINALRKYARMLENDRTSIWNIVIPDLLTNTANLLETLEQKPKTGRWILTDVEGDRIWHCKCSECGKDPQDYIYGSEDWWLTYGNLPKFCPTCGSRNF